MIDAVIVTQSRSLTKPKTGYLLDVLHFPLLFITLALPALLLLHPPILLALGDFLVVQDEPAPADLIHVLGTDRERVDYAVRLGT